MGARAVAWLVCLTLTGTLLACGDDDATSDRPRPDSGLDPAVKDSGLTDAGMNESDASPSDAATDDASTNDSGPVDSGPPLTDSGNPDDGEGIPSAWSCLPTLYADGLCDCGCTAHDADCVAADCTESGCKLESCAACFTSTATWIPCTPDPTPDDRTCDDAMFDDSLCDCGCGAPDPACMDRGCHEPGCRRPQCDRRNHCGAGVTDDSDDCTQVNPPSLVDGDWLCPWDSYGGGDGCDCGCGAHDPDCDVAGCSEPQCYQAACDRCADPDGRPYACDAARGGWDDQIPVTGGYSQCDPARFDADDGCDCGCGGADPDCGESAGCVDPDCTQNACDRCTDASGAVTGCAPPQDWLDVCPPESYGTGDGCDCGCGADDPDCGDEGSSDPASLVAGCDVCHDGVGPYDAGNHYMHYVKCPSWTCTDAASWEAPECDCGCGAIDPYCRDFNRFSCTEPGCQSAACNYCTDENGTRGSCDVSWSGGGTTCSLEDYGIDGSCDCGCGATDPDCQGGGCTEAGCSAPACDVCHDGTSLSVCDPWRCDAALFGAGGANACDCGCGAIDPDCDTGGCKEPGCADAACDACHDSFGRVVPCP